MDQKTKDFITNLEGKYSSGFKGLASEVARLGIEEAPPVEKAGTYVANRREAEKNFLNTFTGASTLPPSEDTLAEISKNKNPIEKK